LGHVLRRPCTYYHILKYRVLGIFYSVLHIIDVVHVNFFIRNIYLCKLRWRVYDTCGAFGLPMGILPCQCSQCGTLYNNPSSCKCGVLKCSFCQLCGQALMTYMFLTYSLSFWCHWTSGGHLGCTGRIWEGCGSAHLSPSSTLRPCNDNLLLRGNSSCVDWLGIPDSILWS
jgi:hypothetical protein